MELFAGNQVVLDDIRIADSFGTRFMGLMGKKGIAPAQGLLLKRCGSVHTCFMRFPITVLYLDGEYRAVDAEELPPWKMGKRVRGARHVLELNPGRIHADDLGSLELRM